ncbi:uncharacterized protein [Oscarella lobularis]|uniref:uncharacterized protein isoform X2 n=1 Tax=Oscarella lobularis TaxID=121494 RepID=UPI0033142440
MMAEVTTILKKTFALLVVATFSTIVVKHVHCQTECTDVDIHCFYAASSNRAYCLPPDNGQSQLTLSPIGGLECDMSLESLAIVSRTYSLIESDCAIIPSLNDVFAETNVTQLVVICDRQPFVYEATEALEILQLQNETFTACACLARAAAAWIFQAVISNQYAFRCGLNQYANVVQAIGQNVTTRKCSNATGNEPCIHGNWRIEVHWTTDVDLVFIINLPDVDNADSTISGCSNNAVDSTTTCEGQVNDATGGQWIVTMGPNDQSGIDGGFEYGEIDVNGVPKGRIFGIRLISLAQSLFADIPVTVKYFFNGAEVVSVALNTSAADFSEWGGSVGEAHIDILDFSTSADPNAFKL